MIPPEFVATVRKIAAGLDTLDYFQVLRIGRDATHEDVRAAYHKQARLFHPDKYQTLGTPELVRDLSAIAKRVAEAYTVLRDDKKRQRYTKDIEGPDRKSKLRYSEESQAEEQREAEVATTAQGKQLFHQATVAFASGNKEGALKSLKMALVYEAKNPVFLQKLAEWTKA